MKNTNLSRILLAGAIAPLAPSSSLSCGAWVDDMSDYEAGDIGTLTMGDLEMMGAVPRRGGGRGRRGGGRGRGGGGHGFDSRKLVPRIPGVPASGARLQPLGFGSSSFTATSGSIIALQAQPQRPFKGQRLVIDLTRTGATATGLVTITRLDVGTANQLVSSGALSASAFAATAFDVNLQLDPATPGILITVQFANSVVPTAPDRIDFSATLFGTAIG